MSLIRRLFSWFLSFTRTTRRLLWQQTSGHHALVTNGDPAGFSCDQHRTCVRCTLYRCQANIDTTDRAIFTIAALFSHTGKHQAGHTYTQRDSCDDRRMPPSTSGFVPFQPFQRFTLFSKAYLKVLALSQCHLTTQAFPELRTLLPILQLSAAFTSRGRQANQSSTVPLSALCKILPVVIFLSKCKITLFSPSV